MGCTALYLFALKKEKCESAGQQTWVELLTCDDATPVLVVSSVSRHVHTASAITANLQIKEFCTYTFQPLLHRILHNVEKTKGEQVDYLTLLHVSEIACM